jgi:hypothetical protein
MITDPVILNPVMEPKYFKTIAVAQGARQQIVLLLTNVKGDTLSLASMGIVKADPCQEDPKGPDAEDPGFPDGISPKSAISTPDVNIRMVVSPGYGMTENFSIEGTVTDFEEAKVAFYLTEEQTRYAGIYMGEIGLFRGTRLLQKWPFYISIEPSLLSMYQETQRSGQITLPEIRLALRDLDPSYNDVLDDVEFKDAEIISAIRTPVDIWCETMPFEDSLQYRYDTFPFRGNWLRATVGYLLEMAAHWYRRNDLAVQAGGVSVRDRDKHLTYEPKSKELLTEYKEWAKLTKTALSMRMGFGGIGSPWPRSSLWR